MYLRHLGVPRDAESSQKAVLHRIGVNEIMTLQGNQLLYDQSTKVVLKAWFVKPAICDAAVTILYVQ